MIITDFNKMTITELKAANRVLKKEFVIEDGRITKVLNKSHEKEDLGE